MELSFLGRGAAFNVQEGNTAAWLREGERLLLLDCGESVFARLTAGGSLKGVREITVLISHLHPDHVGSLGSLIMYCWFVQKETKLRLALPEDKEYAEQVKQLLALGGCKEDWYSAIPASEVSGFSAFSRVDYVPTEHAPGMKCFSFVFETQRGGVFYSADTANAQGLLRFLESHPGAERVYMDASSVSGGVHVSIEELCEVLPPEMREKTFLMHLSDETCQAKGEKEGFHIVKNWA